MGKSMTDYEFLDTIGICHRCRKQKQAPGKKFCFDCLDKNREECRKRYDPEKAKEYQKRRRELYQQKKKKEFVSDAQNLPHMECTVMNAV